MIKNNTMRGYVVTGNVRRGQSQQKAFPFIKIPAALEAARPVGIVAGVALVFTLCLNQLVSWQVNKVEQQINMAISQEKELSNERIRLLSMRARLSSAEHIQAVAGVRLDLYKPEKGQVHKM